MAFATGCSSVSSKYVGDITEISPSRLFVCSGFDCYHKNRIDISAADAKRFASIMALNGTAATERAAISRAVQHFETMATSVIGVADNAKSVLTESGTRGQMDCIDESTNTRTLLLYLQQRGLLKHHVVEGNVSRGFFADGRYPHSTAVIRDQAGVRWAIDSWYEPAGGAPDIMPLKDWLPRGVLGER